MFGHFTTSCMKGLFSWKQTVILTNVWQQRFHSRVRSRHRRSSAKKVFLKISQNSQENTCARVSFLIKLQDLGLQLYWIRDSSTDILCGFCEIFKNTFFTESLRNTAFKQIVATKEFTRSKHYKRSWEIRQTIAKGTAFYLSKDNKFLTILIMDRKRWISYDISFLVSQIKYTYNLAGWI